MRMIMTLFYTLSMCTLPWSKKKKIMFNYITYVDCKLCKSFRRVCTCQTGDRQLSSRASSYLTHPFVCVQCTYLVLVLIIYLRLIWRMLACSHTIYWFILIYWTMLVLTRPGWRYTARTRAHITYAPYRIQIHLKLPTPALHSTAHFHHIGAGHAGNSFNHLFKI